MLATKVDISLIINSFSLIRLNVSVESQCLLKLQQWHMSTQKMVKSTY